MNTTSASNLTQQNWAYCKQSKGGYIRPIAPGESLATVHADDHAVGRLMAAAPELLAALEHILADYDRTGQWTLSADALNAARNAIASATFKTR